MTTDPGSGTGSYLIGIVTSYFDSQFCMLAINSQKQLTQCKTGLKFQKFEIGYGNLGLTLQKQLKFLAVLLDVAFPYYVLASDNCK